MQALRKSSAQDQAFTGTAVVRAERDSLELAGEHSRNHGATLSPALALRDHLAARLEEMAQLKAGDAAVLAEPMVAKLPMPLRMTVIVGLSLSLWLALYFAVVSLL